MERKNAVPISSGNPLPTLFPLHQGPLLQVNLLASPSPHHPSVFGVLCLHCTPLHILLKLEIRWPWSTSKPIPCPPAPAGTVCGSEGEQRERPTQICRYVYYQPIFSPVPRDVISLSHFLRLHTFTCGHWETLQSCRQRQCLTPLCHSCCHDLWRVALCNYRAIAYIAKKLMDCNH